MHILQLTETQISFWGLSLLTSTTEYNIQYCVVQTKISKQSFWPLCCVFPHFGWYFYSLRSINEINHSSFPYFESVLWLALEKEVFCCTQDFTLLRHICQIECCATSKNSEDMHINQILFLPFHKLSLVLLGLFRHATAKGIFCYLVSASWYA